MEFKPYAILSSIICVGLCILSTIKSFGFFGIPEIFGGLLFTNIPAFIYLFVKRNKKKEVWTFMILQNLLVLLSLIGILTS